MRHEGTVGQLLSRTFAVLVALFVLSGAVEVTVMLLQRRATEQLIDRVTPLQLANDDLRAVLADGQRSLRGYLLTSDEQMLDAYAAARDDYDEASRDLRDLSDGRHDERATARQIEAADAWWAIAERQRLAEPRSAEAADYATRGMTAMDGFLTANRDFQNDLADRAEHLHHRNHVLQWIAVAVAVALTVVVGLFAVRAAARTRRWITRPLAGLVTMLERRRAGDREARVDASDGPVEIRAVAEVLNVAADEADRARRGEEEVLARLQAVETVKTDFMATVSHELRTPLTSISGYLELLRDPETGHLTDAQRRMLEVISRNATRLRELIEDMLTLSRIESGDFNSNVGELDLAEVVERAVSAIAPAAAKGSVGLHVEVARPLPVNGDGPQLDRVLGNLLTNAVKFTPAEGTVTVRAYADGDQATLVVADTGMGIPADEKQALFARFFRATNAIRQAVPGTGLGLAIVHTIVQNHGGTIEVDSTENVGTTVTVRLPAS